MASQGEVGGGNMWLGEEDRAGSSLQAAARAEIKLSGGGAVPLFPSLVSGESQRMELDGRDSFVMSDSSLPRMLKIRALSLRELEMRRKNNRREKLHIRAWQTWGAEGFVE